MPPLKKINLNTQPLEKVNFNVQPLEKINIKDLEKVLKKKRFHDYELNISDSRIKYFDKIIKENPKMSAKKINIINQLNRYILREKIILKLKLIIQKLKHLV